MTQHWNVVEDCLEIFEMPFYWRLSNSASEVPGICSRLRINIIRNDEHDYLKYEPGEDEWSVIDLSYRQNENIGFLNPESGQLNTYGSSANNFFLEVIKNYSPKNIYEIGCGAGFSIHFLKENGWNIIGIDPSEYSCEWSKRLHFPLLKTFFSDGLLTESADLIYCNDVFEHVRNAEDFCESVYKTLGQGGVFCIVTTNSSQSIKLGDISMLEHQHVNMFTERSIYSILASAGFTEIHINKGTYGNTFHIVAIKSRGAFNKEIPRVSSEGFFQRAKQKIERFNHSYKNEEDFHFYVPLRCIPYLATVGDFGNSYLYDSNQSWRGKYIDGFSLPLRSIDDIECKVGRSFFIGSLTFYEEIKTTLVKSGFSESKIFSITNI